MPGRMVQIRLIWPLRLRICYLLLLILFTHRSPFYVISTFSIFLRWFIRFNISFFISFCTKWNEILALCFKSSLYEYFLLIVHDNNQFLRDHAIDRVLYLFVCCVEVVRYEFMFIIQNMKQKNKKVGNYFIKMDECLGRGGFAAAYKAYKDKNFNEPYACKLIQKQDIEKVLQSSLNYFVNRVQEEYKALQSLKHPNIVQFLDVEQTANNLYLFFEYCECDLQKYIQQHFFERNEQEIYSFARQIISACHYFTSKDFVHRDIKPANILLKNKQIKIADFGLATQIGDVEKSVTFAGTPQYMAPQILKGVKMKEISRCDVWSVGVTIYELCNGQLPFGMSKKDLSEQRIISHIQNKNFEIKIEKHPILEKLVRLMLVVEPADRISFEEANQMVQKEQFESH